MLPTEENNHAAGSVVLTEVCRKKHQTARRETITEDAQAMSVQGMEATNSLPLTVIRCEAR